MNSFKLLLLLLLAIAFGVLFAQNRQPLSLKLLCPDTASSCWYQTPSLPLAFWIALFVLAGILSSLFWHLLNSFAYASNRKSSYIPSRSEESNTQLWNTTTPSTISSDTETESKANASSYEIDREPETVRRSGSTYSYKFKDKSNDSNELIDRENRERKNNEDEEWI